MYTSFTQFDIFLLILTGISEEALLPRMGSTGLLLQLNPVDILMPLPVFHPSPGSPGAGCSRGPPFSSIQLPFAFPHPFRFPEVLFVIIHHERYQRGRLEVGLLRDTLNRGRFLNRICWSGGEDDLLISSGFADD